MLTPQEKAQITQAVGKIKDLFDMVADGHPDDYDTTKLAVEAYNILSASVRICPYCGMEKVVEAEVFSQDKLFTSHSSKGMYKKEG